MPAVAFWRTRATFALSQTTSYALLALSCLARDRAAWHLVREISDCVGVPSPYLSKVLHGLARSGLVETKRGYKGGYRLARPATTIRLLDIVRALDDRRLEERCMLGLAQCSDERACPMHEFWKAARSEIVARLEGITLADLARFEDFRRICRGPSPARVPAGRVARAAAKAVPKRRKTR